LYPAQPISPPNTYPDTDLPDSVTINWPSYYEGNANRNGRGYVAGDISLAINSAQTAWVLSDSITGRSRTVGNCLLREAGGAVIDQFKAEYNFNDTYDWGPNHSEYTLPRTGLCIWEVVYHEFGYTEPYTPEREGALAFARLTYQSSPGVSAGRPGWFLETARLFEIFSGTLSVDTSGEGYRDGDQNKPNGTYTDVFNAPIIIS
jgi:hypothetical protein